MSTSFDLHACVRTIPPSTILIREGKVPDAVYILIRGRVRVMRQRQVEGWLAESYVPFGLEALQDAPSPVSYVTHPDQQVEVARVPVESFPALLAELPQAAIRMFFGMQAHGRALVAQMDDMRMRAEEVSRQWKVLSLIFEDLVAKTSDPGVSSLAEWIRKHPLNAGQKLSANDPAVAALPAPVRALLVRLSCGISTEG